jgi:hypothetical protein
VWQAIVPTDLASSTATDWRGITAWELSILQARLTAKTRNVVVILDACHASHMSRDSAAPRVVTRALPHPILAGFEAHLAALRRSYGAVCDAVDPVSNADAVRLVACGQKESAFEYGDAADRYRGVFTEELLAVLAQTGDARPSWASVGAAVRTRVLRRYITQRPDVEGPARRRLFSLVEDDDVQRPTLHTT